jgi:hypothetical protein
MSLGPNRSRECTFDPPPMPQCHSPRRVVRHVTVGRVVPSTSSTSPLSLSLSSVVVSAGQEVRDDSPRSPNPLLYALPHTPPPPAAVRCTNLFRSSCCTFSSVDSVRPYLGSSLRVIVGIVRSSRCKPPNTYIGLSVSHSIRDSILQKVYTPLPMGIV